ncbi:coagulation factor XIII B chain-like isoform X3 [Ambystoma mexicanum]|uniref:coagulation factor XIII B chain-like isoform X3 n=1 Tax=Ambystoma mexicanum TaxID=8296 RepID=UPI0037E78916
MMLRGWCAFLVVWAFFIAQGKCDQVSLNDMNILYEDSTYTEGTTASYECHSEFGTPEGNKGGIIECLPDGQFSKAECIESTCSLANTSRYHHFISDRTFKNGHAVKFDCEEGYKLIGSPKIQCYYFGWYPEPPHCNDAMNPTSPGGVRPPLLQLKASAETEEQCPPPPTLANIEEGSMKAAYYNGDTIMYDCEENYKRYGSAHITCVKGTWTSPPQCIKEIKCGPAPFIAHGDIVSIQQKFFNSGTFVDYKCQDLHIMRGPSRVRCRKGSWSALPECLGHQNKRALLYWFLSKYEEDTLKVPSRDHCIWKACPVSLYSSNMCPVIPLLILIVGLLFLETSVSYTVQTH